MFLIFYHFRVEWVYSHNTLYTKNINYARVCYNYVLFLSEKKRLKCSITKIEIATLFGNKVIELVCNSWWFHLRIEQLRRFKKPSKCPPATGSCPTRPNPASSEAAQPPCHREEPGQGDRDQRNRRHALRVHQRRRTWWKKSGGHTVQVRNGGRGADNVCLPWKLPHPCWVCQTCRWWRRGSPS